MKNSGNKGQLIPWLRDALDKRLYRGLGWENKTQNIFYIVWTHKSAEGWSDDVLIPFKEWAAHKGKLNGKNGKQLKATFRCALNSKKDELRELGRQRGRRYWQFIDPNCEDGKSISKKKRKMNNKLKNAPSVESDSISNSFMNFSSSTMDSSGEDLCISSDEMTSKRRKRKTISKLVDKVIPCISSRDSQSNFSNCLTSLPTKSKTETSGTDKLPPFQSIYSFQPLTPPYQANETFLNLPELSTNFNTPDASRLTPPAEILQKKFHSSAHNSSLQTQFSTDVWQPNCWTTSAVHQDINGLNQFFSYEFDDMADIANHEFYNSKLNFSEMDQSVPVMNTVNQVFFQNEQFNYTNKPIPQNSLCEQVKLDDDYIFSSDFNPDPEEEKIIQELNRISYSPQTDLYSFDS